MSYTLSNLVPGSAEYVQMHAVLRHRRGKKPSMTYKDERNPRKALLLAQAELQHYASLDQWRMQVSFLRRGVVDYQERIDNIKREVRMCSFTLTDIGTSKKEFKHLRKTNIKFAAEHWLNALRLSSVNYDIYLRRFEEELVKGRLTLWHVGSNKTEIFRLIVEGRKAVARFWLDSLRSEKSTLKNRADIYIRAAVSEGGFSLKDIGTDEAELRILSTEVVFDFTHAAMA